MCINQFRYMFARLPQTSQSSSPVMSLVWRVCQQLTNFLYQWQELEFRLASELFLWVLIKRVIFVAIFDSCKMEQQAAQEYEKKMMQEAQKQEQQEQRQAILSQILTPEAKERLMKIKTVKPEKATGIENSLINAARTGQLKNRISEGELVSLLEKDNERRGEQKVTFKRRGIDDEW